MRGAIPAGRVKCPFPAGNVRRALEILGRAAGQPAESCGQFCAESFAPGTQDSCIMITTEPEERVRFCLHLEPGRSLLVLRPELPTEKGDAE